MHAFWRPRRCIRTKVTRKAMEKTRFWVDAYVEKRHCAAIAIGRICSGQRVFVASACGIPGHLVRELVQAAPRLHGLEILRLETAADDLLSSVTRDPRHVNRIVCLGSSIGTRPDSRFLTPINLSALPRLLKQRNLPIHVALVQACPPDDFGWMSLGVSVDVVLAACQAAERVIVQVNPRMPRTLGRGFIHVNDVDDIVEYEEDVATVSWPSSSASETAIARHVQRLVDDESTLQLSPGPLSEAILRKLSGKRHLGIHTGYLTDAMMHLFSVGAVTNRKKGLNEGKLTACGALGSRRLYEFLDNNPAVEFHPADYIHHPGIISSHHRMVAINEAVVMDLTGQVAAIAPAGDRFGGITAMADFIRGAAQARHGKPIIVLQATDETGKSRIIAQLADIPVALQRGDVHDVVTEFGAVNLFGKSLQERALAMISIAHPDVRESLFEEAQTLGLLGSERALKASIRGVYPLELEETVVIDAKTVTIRPAKPVDERRIQEHFYNLPVDDVISRFFQKRTRFHREELEPFSQIDYIKGLTLVAVVGEFGFEKVVAMGGYLLEVGDNMAEVAFSVDRNWQGKGLGKRLGAKLAAAARENGIAGLTAYTLSHNRSMVRLFNSLPFKVKTRFEYDTLLLSCRFDEIRAPD